jgi:uncharacterized membrane protein
MMDANEGALYVLGRFHSSSKIERATIATMVYLIRKALLSPSLCAFLVNKLYCLFLRRRHFIDLRELKHKMKFVIFLKLLIAVATSTHL